MNTKQSLSRALIALLIVFGVYRVQKDAIIFSRDFDKPRALRLEHTVCNPRVLMEVLKISKVKGVSVKYSTDDHPAGEAALNLQDERVSNATTSPDEGTASKFENSSKSEGGKIISHPKVIDTTRKSQRNQTRLNVYTASSGKVRPVMYVRSIHPMHIDLKTHVRRKIEEGIDIDVIPINAHPFKYIHSPSECDFEPTTDSFNLVFLVKSSVRNFPIRDSIRKTWGNVTDIKNVKVMFLIAYQETAQADIDKEASLSSDIIQENFIDAYKNNTLKTIMGFNWAVEKCSQSDVLFFVDDDHLVHIRNVMAYLRTFNRIQMKKLYAGFRIEKPEVDRRDGSPWGMSNYDFSHILWPAYLRGGAFVISSEIAHRYVIGFPFVKLLSVDDSYLGIVADKLGILPQHEHRFKMDKLNLTSCPDYFVYNDYKNPQEIKSAWRTISTQDS